MIKTAAIFERFSPFVLPIAGQNWDTGAAVRL